MVDDVHELAATDALAQLELLVMRALRSCGSCSPSVMICGWGCTGCDWRAS